jgi:SAM-dependent methyltransferase
VDAETWNRRYAEEGYAYGAQPNAFLMQMKPLLRAGGRVLCLGDGEGRNGVWLATQGFDVTSLDWAAIGLRKAEWLARRIGAAITTVEADVTTHDLQAGGPWDAMVSIFLHLPAAPRRALHARCVQALRPGGVFVLECYTSEQLHYASGGPREAELLPTLAELETEFPGCTIEHQFSGERLVLEGRLHTGLAHVAQIVVRRPG